MEHPIYLTQLIYILEGQEEIFNRFEALVLPRIPAYRGEVLLRVRPDALSLIEGTMDIPYEIHLVSFPDETSLEQYTADPVRKEFLHLKNASIRSSLLIKGKTVR
ncbi:MAG: DUF1330 domain-containing protein [Saprospiraceae bacterium]|nr:DUF1330 domain-containing protein [Saprospiraceae bacterium]